MLQSLLDSVKYEHKTSLSRLQSQLEAERQARIEVTKDRDILERKLELLTQVCLITQALVCHLLFEHVLMRARVCPSVLQELQSLKDSQAALGSSKSSMEAQFAALQRDLAASRAENDSNRQVWSQLMLWL